MHFDGVEYHYCNVFRGQVFIPKFLKECIIFLWYIHTYICIIYVYIYMRTCAYILPPPYNTSPLMVDSGGRCSWIFYLYLDIYIFYLGELICKTNFFFCHAQQVWPTLLPPIQDKSCRRPPPPTCSVLICGTLACLGQRGALCTTLIHCPPPRHPAVTLRHTPTSTPRNPILSAYDGRRGGWRAPGGRRPPCGQGCMAVPETPFGGRWGSTATPRRQAFP